VGVAVAEVQAARRRAVVVPAAVAAAVVEVAVAEVQTVKQRAVVVPAATATAVVVIPVETAVVAGVAVKEHQTVVTTHPAVETRKGPELVDGNIIAKETKEVQVVAQTDLHSNRDPTLETRLTLS